MVTSLPFPLPPFSSITATPHCRSVSRNSSACKKLQFLRALLRISIHVWISLALGLRSISESYSLNDCMLSNLSERSSVTEEHLDRVVEVQLEVLLSSTCLYFICLSFSLFLSANFTYSSQIPSKSASISWHASF